MKEKIAQLISNNVEGIEMSDIIASIEIPPRPDMGDFAFPCFRLAKVLRKAPNMIAADIKEAIGCRFHREDRCSRCIPELLYQERCICKDNDRGSQHR